MIQGILLNQYNNKLEKQFIKLFHRLGIPMRSNPLGKKGYSNYQRISTILLFIRSKRSLRDFINQFHESKWTSWLDLKIIPSKSTLHSWLKYFNLKIIRKINNFLRPKNINLTAIDGTGFDSFHRSRHYEKRVGFTQTPYAKVDLFVDISTKNIIDFSLVTKHQHDIIAAKQMIKRNKVKGYEILCDKGYDSEEFHRQIHDKGGKLYAPVRKMGKWSNKKYPKGWFRKKCLKLPKHMGQRSIIECINAVLKRRFVNSLRSKKSYMKKREFGWTIIVYNLDRERINSSNNLINMQNDLKIFFIQVWVFY